MRGRRGRERCPARIDTLQSVFVVFEAVRELNGDAVRI